MNQLDARFQKSLELKHELSSKIPTTPFRSARLSFARNAIDLACEHHAAITLLMNTNTTASAATLLRPLIEAGALVYWFLYYVPSNRLQLISDPQNPCDCSQLTKALGNLKSVPLLKQLNIGKLLDALTTNRTFDQLTHNGKIQLLRRLYPENFSLRSRLFTLSAADRFVLIAAAPSTLLYPDANLEAYFRAKIDESSAELRDFNEAIEPWADLPQPPQFSDDWDNGKWRDPVNEWMMEQY